MKKGKFLATYALLFTISMVIGQSQDLQVFGTIKGGSYQMGAVKMIPSGAGFKSIRFENETEVLAQFNASFDAEPPALKVGKVSIGNIDIVNPIGLPNDLFFDRGVESLLHISRTQASILADRFDINGLLSANRGLNIGQNVQPFSVWSIVPAPTTGTLEFFLNGALKARINTSGTYSALSDERLKTAIEPLYPTLANVLMLSAKSYLFKDTPDAMRSIGFIAQEVAALFPELVEGDPAGEGLLSVNYSDFGIVAIKAIQEQQALINKLENRIAALEALQN